MRPWLTLLPWFVSCLVSQAAANNPSEARPERIQLLSRLHLVDAASLSSPRLAMVGIIEREGRVGGAPANSLSTRSQEVPGVEDSNSDWFQRAGYGVFVHYLEDLQNDPQQVHSLGRETSWDECVREFDARRFANAMGEAGAGYVIFTMHQRTRFLIAPNATFDRLTGYRPGEACSTRDLVEDLYQALHANLHFSPTFSTAKPESSREVSMQVRKAKPRPSGGRELGNRVSLHPGGFGSALNLILLCAGAVLPQPGFRCHLPRGEKSGLRTSR